MTILEKVNRLELYIAAGSSAIDPVIDIAVDKLLEREVSRMYEAKARLMDQLKKFEVKYSLNSSDFYNRYENGKMDDAMDFVEWAATVEMLTNTENRLALLKKVNS